MVVVMVMLGYDDDVDETQDTIEDDIDGDLSKLLVGDNFGH